MIVVKITRKCGICGEEINLVLDILDLVYDEKTKRFLHAKCEKERLLRRKRGRMPSDEVDSLVEKMSVDAREAIAKCVTQKRRSTGSRNREKNTSDNPKRLLTDYLLYTYDLSCMPKYIYVKLASVYSGKYEGLKKPSKLARESDYGKCVQYIDEYKSTFPNFFLEMQSHNTDEQCRYNQKVLELAEETNTEFVITTDSHAATKDDLYYQARHVQIAHDDETLTELYDGCYIQSEAEIYEVMSSQIGEENVKLGLASTNKVADMIENVDMPFQAPQLPTYPLPDGFEDNLSYLKHLTEKGWEQRGFDKLNGDAQRIREKRLEYELGIIHQMGFDGYFLIVWDFIKYAKENGQAVGDGRGSGGGSIVNFLLGISELDPIENDLIFERFLNPERVSMPDVDCDFSNREFIVDYLTQKYGEDHVCQIINYSYITPIVAIKDVGKVLGIPYSVCDRISKKFTYKTFEECLENNKSLLDDYSESMWIMMKLPLIPM